jgi:hypothetical protein
MNFHRDNNDNKNESYSPVEARLGGGVLLQPADLEELFVSSAFVTPAPAPDAVPKIGSGFVGFLITVVDLFVVFRFHCCTHEKLKISEIAW